MSSISVKPAAATRGRANPIAGESGVAETEAGTDGARKGSERLRLFHVKQNCVDDFGR
jgi:hypothetical protein